ncbi:MAG: DinB family protein [Verrucomicrobiota bacterium]
MPSIIEDNIVCLRQGEALLNTLDNASYARPHEVCHGSSIGGHLRHNIDHYFCFLRGLATGTVDYDARARDNQLERSIEAAQAAISEIINALNQLGESDLDKDINAIMDSGNADTVPARSTVRRELKFLLSHTVHHYALISTICRLEGHLADESFGVAPSTLKHQLAD